MDAIRVPRPPRWFRQKGNSFFGKSGQQDGGRNVADYLAGQNGDYHFVSRDHTGKQGAYRRNVFQIPDEDEESDKVRMRE